VKKRLVVLLNALNYGKVKHFRKGIIPVKEVMQD
jgi:hypothetical protein